MLPFIKRTAGGSSQTTKRADRKSANKFSSSWNKYLEQMKPVRTSLVLRALILICGFTASHLVASSGDLCFSLSYIYDSTRCSLSPYHIGNWDLTSLRIKGQFFVFATCVFIVLGAMVLGFLTIGERHLALERFILLVMLLATLTAAGLECWFASGYGECFGRFFDMFSNVYCRANNWIAAAVILFLTAFLLIGDMVSTSLNKGSNKGGYRL